MRHSRSGIPIDHLKQYLDDCKNIAPHIISVGCGNGVYEFEATKHDPILAKKLILVDPSPESYELWPKSGFLKPNYPTVEDLIKQKPEVVGNCVLLLIWLNIEDHFDFPAFDILKPLSVVCMNEHVNGDFNSPSGVFKRNFLLHLLDPVRFASVMNRIPNKHDAVNLCKEPSSGDFMGCSGSIAMNIVMIAPEIFGYSQISQTRYSIRSTCGPLYPRLTWIAKKGSKIPKNKKSSDPKLQLESFKDSYSDADGTKPDTGYDNFCSSVNFVKTPSAFAEFASKS